MTTHRTESQNSRLLKFLKTGKKISPLMALNRMGIMRLASRCFELSKDHNIQSEMVHAHPVHYKRYWLVKKKTA